MPIYRKECGIKTFLVCIWILKSFTSPSEHPVPDTRAPSSRSLGRGMHGRRWPHGSQETSQVKTPWRKHANAALCWKKAWAESKPFEPTAFKMENIKLLALLCSYKSDTSLATGWQGHPAIGSSSSKQSEGVTVWVSSKMHRDTDFNPNDLFESCSPQSLKQILVSIWCWQLTHQLIWWYPWSMFHLEILEGPASFRLCGHGLGWRGATRRCGSPKMVLVHICWYLLFLRFMHT